MSVAVEIVLVDDVVDLLLGGLHSPQPHGLGERLREGGGT